ncbi:MAG: Stk1 family PASTA domain-containing Ser/Thr kinase [Actinomycetes bacterium]
MSDAPRVLGGRYQLARVIGRGGMAIVSQARDLRLGREVAVKELRIDLAGDSTFQARFRREAQAAAGLNHPNIVSVYDTGEETDPRTHVPVPYIVMELVQGRTLRDILREGRPILPQRALEFTVGVLEALDYSHKAGIIHRDIKPANVMLTSTGIVKVMDFGIARAVSDTSSTMTQTAAVIGTAQYLSPEQARGETVDARSDIYSAGCLMYELLVGRPPFQGDSPVSVAYQHVREQPVPPSQLDAEVTAPMDAVVLKALAKDPDDRYATAGQMRDDVNRILGGHRVSATLPPPVPPLVAASTAAAMAAPTAVMAAGPSSPQTGSTLSGETGTGALSPVEPERRNRGRMGWTAAVVSLLLVGVVAGFFLFERLQEPQVREVAVPTGLINRDRAVAENMLREVKLNPVVEPVELADRTTIGMVVETDPIGGVVVPEGSNVTLRVNVGPRQLTIPNGLVGLAADEARRLLTEAGFTDVRQVDATDEPADAARNTVVDVTPDSGTQATASTTITLAVATGRARVPFLTGLTREQAEAEARRYGVTLTFEEQENDAPAGQVIGTRPQQGTLVDKDEPIVVVLAKPRPTPTPSPVQSQETTQAPPATSAAPATDAPTASAPAAGEG